MGIKNKLIVSSAAALIALSGSNLYAQQSESCELPGSPVIPDGNVASMDELLSAQTAVKGYQANLADYRSCLNDERLKQDMETEEGKAAVVALNVKHNESVDAEEQVGVQFNDAVKAYKARN